MTRDRRVRRDLIHIEQIRHWVHKVCDRSTTRIRNSKSHLCWSYSRSLMRAVTFSLSLRIEVNKFEPFLGQDGFQTGHWNIATQGKELGEVDATAPEQRAARDGRTLNQRSERNRSRQQPWEHPYRKSSKCVTIRLVSAPNHIFPYVDRRMVGRMIRETSSFRSCIVGKELREFEWIWENILINKAISEQFVSTFNAKCTDLKCWRVRFLLQCWQPPLLGSSFWNGLGKGEDWLASLTGGSL